MTRADIVKLLGAAAALVGVVALISPPTKPIPTPAGDWREQVPVKTGTPPPAASTTPVPAEALMRKPPPPKVEEDRRIAVVEQQPPAPAGGVVYREIRPPDDLAARRFRQGYDWAERNAVDDERDCYRERGDPFTDGCLAALTDPAFEYEPRGRYRRDRW